MNDGDHQQIKALLSAYLEGELAPEQREKVEQALQESVELREEKESLAAMLTSLAEMNNAALPPNFARQVENRWRRGLRPERKKHSFTILPFAWIAFVLILALLVLYLLVLLKAPT